jgi:hypothetical protein
MPTREEKAAARVAAIRSAWTPERRKAASEAAKARRAAETPEQRAARLAKRKKTMEANPDIEKQRAENIARTRRTRRDKMSEVAKTAYQQKSDEARAASLANLKAAHTSETKAKRSETVKTPRIVRKQRKVEQAERDAAPREKMYRMREWTDEDRRKNGEQAKVRWAALTPEQHEAIMQKRMAKYAEPDVKAAMCRTRQRIWDEMSPDRRSARLRRMQDGRRLKEYTLVNGAVERFHSSWEAACANVLIGLGIRYRPQVHFLLGGVNYFADFVIDTPEGWRTIIEVKGHPKAWVRWNDVTVPALHRELRGDWHVYLLDHKPRGLQPATLTDFLRTMARVATGRPLQPGEVATAPVSSTVLASLDISILD